MQPHRTAYFASSVLTSLACLVLAGCSVGVQAGAPAPKAPAHEPQPKRQADSSTKTPSKKPPKQHEAAATKKDIPTEPKREETPKKTTDSPQPTETPLKAGMSRLVVPVNVSFKTVNDKLEEELPKTESRDWKRVTKKGKKTEVDVRYKVWREPIKLSVRDHTIRVVVPVDYTSEFRAKVDKPIGKGSIWLTHGETWGTVDHKQHMDVTIDLSLSVGEDYQLESHSKLVSIVHGAPPSGNACAKAGIKICVPKQELASYVEDELNEHLGKKVEKALKKGDKKVSKLFDLEKRVSTLWSGLSTPVELQKPKQVNCPTVVGEACSKSAWLTFAPSALGLSAIELDGDVLGVRVGLEGKLTVTEAKPNPKTPGLPKLQPLSGGTAFELTTAFDIPIAHLAEQLNQALAKTPIYLGSESLKFKSASISVTDAEKKTVALEILTETDQRFGLSAKLDYDAKKKRFGLNKLLPNSATKALLEKERKDLDLAELQKTIDEHASVALSQASEALRQAVTNALRTALPGKVRLKGTLSELALEDFSLTDQAIAAKVVLKGPLSVELAP